MKKIILLFGFLSALLTYLNAQDYVLTVPVGWGTGVTGGGTNTPVIVNTESALRNALKSNSVIIIDGTVALDSTIYPTDINNLTVLGRNGAVLNSVEGVFVFRNSSNVIVRNMKFVGPGSATDQRPDLLCLENTTLVWIDHCEFVDGADGNFDIRSSSNYIAVTWCKFSYTDKSGIHAFSNLIGSSDRETSDRGTLKVTFQYCWWAEGVQERMPRVRFGQVHVVNNLYTSAVSNYCIRGGFEADLYIDKNAFVGVKSPVTHNENQNFNCTFTSDNLLSNVSETNTKEKIDALAGRQGEATWNPYTTSSYLIRAIPASDVQRTVSHAACGAGATLLVAADGTVSSTCTNVR